MTSIRKLIFTFILLLGSGFITCSHAQESGLNIITIGPNSRAFGLNEAVTADLNGASNIYTNPANLVLESSSSASADYNLWIGGINNTHAAINFRKNNHALAFGFIASEIDDLELRSTGPGPSEGTFSSTLVSLAAAYAYNWRNIAAGITGQYLLEKYYIYNASGYSLNLGISGQWWSDRILTGITLQNLGMMNELYNESTDLPTTLRVGVRANLFRFLPPKNDDLPIRVSLRADLVNPLQTVAVSTQDVAEAKPYANIALTFDIAETVSVFSGYKTGNTVRPWSAGASILVGSIRANYAIIPFEIGFSPAHSLGIEYLF